MIKHLTFLAGILFLTTTLFASKNFYPGTIYLVSGEKIVGNIAAPTHSSQNKLKYEDSKTGNTTSIESNEIKYISFKLGNTQQEFKYATEKKITKNKVKDSNKKKWFLRMGDAGGDKIGIYLLANLYNVNDKKNIVTGSTMTSQQVLIDCISKADDASCVFVKNNAEVMRGRYIVPHANATYKKQYKVIAAEYLADQPTIAQNLDEEDMSLEDICTMYYQLSK